MPDPKHGAHQGPQFEHAPQPKQLAQAFAELGRTCFPCKGKRPLDYWTAYQTQGPTTQQVENWWAQHPMASVGIPAGALNGITVVDVDDCGHAPETLPKLLALIGHTPLVVQTPGKGGGYHLYYRHNGERNGQGWKLDGFGGDIRGEGGFVMAPGSLHLESQRTYRIDGDIDWFLHQLDHLMPMRLIKPFNAPQTGEGPVEGGRNLWLFKQARQFAQTVQTKADLEAQVLAANAGLPCRLRH